MDSERTDLTLHSTFGALYVGMVVSAALWGVSCVQTWYYFNNYRRDILVLRCGVFACWLSDTIHQCLITHVLYSYTISHFGGTDYLEKIVWSLYAEIIFNGVTGFLVQSFFTYRIWTSCNQLKTSSLLVLAELGTSVAYMIQGGHLPTFVELKELKPPSMSINVIAAAGDVAISAAIFTFLNGAKSGFAWSNHIINRLIFSINTGLLTSIRACCSLISILSLPNTLVYFAFYYTSKSPEIFESAQIVKLPPFHSRAIHDPLAVYSNSLLATLNARPPTNQNRFALDP
ncbi:hypothetical protein ARMSODRAFT_1088781 [Armillaria solidipes]|uniref:DUF6534 domain-containing protein n=1 Tax=Armillaria solidipes TaxID=1076256 RepID=A0A2H3B2Z7_9AGAR|nr:hypothetical protein ARMSODRAFT_1088781 [Armillaria solidipes]